MFSLSVIKLLNRHVWCLEAATSLTSHHDQMLALCVLNGKF